MNYTEKEIAELVEQHKYEALIEVIDNLQKQNKTMYEALKITVKDLKAGRESIYWTDIIAQIEAALAMVDEH